jgi:hypothetical protein
MFATMNSGTASSQLVPATRASSAVTAAPENANTASIVRLLWVRSAMAPVIGSTSTCTTVASEIR